MKTGCITAGRYTIRLITHNYRCKDQQREKEVERRNISVQEKCSRASFSLFFLSLSQAIDSHFQCKISVKESWQAMMKEKKLLNVNIIFLYLHKFRVVEIHLQVYYFHSILTSHTLLTE